jgi:nicotinamide mononucleotide (NMN) deamidase PncC
VSAPWTSQFVRQIHHAPGRVSLCVTGGGSQAISALLEEPGASRSVLEAVVPYAAAALVAWLRATPEHFCSEGTARLMAMAAYNRAVEYARPSANTSDETGRVAGVACTAGLASDRPKRGVHRIHAALQTGTCTVSHSIELIKGRRSRGEEERIAAALVLNLVAEFKGLTDRVDPGLMPQEEMVVTRCDAPLDWQQLLRGEKRLVAVTAAASPDLSVARRLVFPGAFHPRHEGHRQMALMAGEKLGLPVEHELSIFNVDKPPIDFIEMRSRAAQFAPTESLWFSRAPTFVQKAGLFPHATFIVGADTVARIAEARYYGGETDRNAALAALAATGCRFLVFGRSQEGRFRSLGDLPLPDVLRGLCDEVPGETFRLDVSSTALRAEGNLADRKEE